MAALLMATATLLLCLWPFIGRSGPGYAPAFALAAGTVLAVGAVETGARRLDARGLALLAAIAALDSALRAAFPIGFGGFSPFFLLVLCAGYALGPAFGFMAGAFAMLASDVALGALGTYLPFQLLAAGWTGAVAGLAGRALGQRGAAPRLPGLIALAAVGAVMGYLFGALTDIQDWTTFYRGAAGFGWVPGLDPLTALRRFGGFYAATSFVYDSFRAAGNAVLVLAVGAPVIAALGRFGSRLQFEVETP
ncbi:MAG TPA: ECF transporter S component [Candidatus Dormibacteraeota bacterium]